MCLVLTLLVFSHALLLSPSAARTDVIDTGRSMAADGPLVSGGLPLFWAERRWCVVVARRG